MIIASAKTKNVEVDGNGVDLLNELTLSVKAVSQVLCKKCSWRFRDESEASMFLIEGIQQGLKLAKTRETILKETI